METKSLLIGIISFMLGGLVVATAATTFEKDRLQGDSMEALVTELTNKKGEGFDHAFIDGMIAHHEAAVSMARLSENRASHQEIKDMSRDIISAQSKEIEQLKSWQKSWGYQAGTMDH